MRQPAPALAIAPLMSDGISPERMREDLPLPDVPTTERKRVVRSRRRSSSISFSRPKKRWSSSASNGRRPGNGLNRVSVNPGGPRRRPSARRRETKGASGSARGIPGVDHDALVRAEAILLRGPRLEEADRRSRAAAPVRP